MIVLKVLGEIDRERERKKERKKEREREREREKEREKYIHIYIYTFFCGIGPVERGRAHRGSYAHRSLQRGQL